MTTTTARDEQQDPAPGPSPVRSWVAGFEHVLRGDRPFVLAFLLVVLLAIVILSGPLRTWSGQRDLIEQREATLAMLEEENQRLGERVEDLNDPGTIEAEAREEQGMYRPGEVPYVILPPEVDQPRLGTGRVDDAEERGWFQRLREALREMIGG